MHPADGVILAVIAVSLLLGLYRGFVREAFSLAGWVAAYVVARIFHPALELMLADSITTPSLRLAAAWGGLFLATLVVVSLAGYMIRSLMEAAGVRLVDRLLGGVFGLARGGILVLASLVLLAPMVHKDAWWREARLPGVFMRFEPQGRELKEKVEEAARSAAGESPAARDKGAGSDGQR